jgi:hypothetical protein
MIGVIADPGERPVVAEFFELFKTPWEFYENEGHYDVLICSGAPVENSNAKLVLIYSSQNLPGDAQRGTQVRTQSTNRVILANGGRIPIYGKCATFKASGASMAMDEENHLPVSQTVVSAHQVIVRVGFDLFQEVWHLLTQGQAPVHAMIPTLELHIDSLRSLMMQYSIPWIEIPPVPEGHNFTACLTHDVDHVGIRNHRFDHTLAGFLYRALLGSIMKVGRGRMSLKQMAVNWGAAMRLPLVHLGLAKDFWYQFEHYLELERDLNSTFFVVPFKGVPGMDVEGSKPSARATRYDIGDIPEEISRLKRADREIGLHGIDAWLDCEQGKAEQERTRQASGTSKVGVRMHWLCFNENSPKTLEKAGFWYDSTVGYNQCIGYRAGTGQVYRHPGTAKLLELPMLVMDTALFYPNYLDLSPAEAEQQMSIILQNALRYGGSLTVNWHDRSIAPERLWDQIYVKLLGQLKSEGAWFPTAAQSVSWFEMRRSAVFEHSGWDGQPVRVRVPANAAYENLPGLRLRSYNCFAKVSGGSVGEETLARYTDVPLNQASDECLALQN